ncbi:MAG: Fe-S cluster assembly protein SufD [Prevotella sp.]|nr:Fe-S cluster assembly protein SufD [Prevotella sp.]
MNSEQQYIDLYCEARQMVFNHSNEVMNAVRDQAFEDFQRLGFPSQKVERYKYTDMQRLFAPNYGVNLNRLTIPADPYKVFSCDVPNLSTCLYFMVNDAFYVGGEGREANAPKLPEGVVIDSMQSVFSHHSPLTSHLQERYGRLAKTGDDAVTALNTMLAQDGLLVYVPRGVKVEKTVQVINMLKSPFGSNYSPPSQGGAGGGSFMVNRRVLIVLEEGAELKMLFCDHAADDRDFLTTQVIEAYVGEGAQLELYCLEETHNKNVRVSNVYIDQQRDSRVVHNVITLHNGVTRNKLDLTLNGEGAECQCYGCVIADKQQHVDNNTLIIHHATHCTSNELYKYVLDDKATGAFAGRVLVEPGAQKTVSQMTNQNLCASRDARMYTQPMLEIYADDVKCAHGSTVGQLNDQALFYMRQRGIPEKEARTLLQTAFINQVIDQITLIPLRDRLHYLVDRRFRGELNKCEGCKLCQ